MHAQDGVYVIRYVGEAGWSDGGIVVRDGFVMGLMEGQLTLSGQVIYLDDGGLVVDLVINALEGGQLVTGLTVEPGFSFTRRVELGKEHLGGVPFRLPMPGGEVSLALRRAVV
ncbi:hypothetical protein NK718_16750 [Alsobacter sp. SYSU M60028]|uniref:Uncharacterized protein n=1 Tax=Alsobacter ponti TaxID=2962936 RepID=A0ABT1LH21_9HYPH|nr:hypothetical protein [Alsobacter ponti]MCP8940178.1 hypothetical protein [Alsobacter ponti]